MVSGQRYVRGAKATSRSKPQDVSEHFRLREKFDLVVICKHITNNVIWPEKASPTEESMCKRGVLSESSLQVCWRHAT